MEKESPNSFDALIEVIREVVADTLKDEIPNIVSHNIFSLLGAAWQSGYSARDANIQWYIDRAQETVNYSMGLQTTVDTQQQRINELEMQVNSLVREKVGTNG